MNQPPTIPEGDEENEGVEQVGEGTRFPQRNAAQAVPPIHDTVTAASDLQPREDSGVGYGHTPTMPNEMVAVGGEDTNQVAQQAEYPKGLPAEGEEVGDQAKIEGELSGHAEEEAHGQLDESGALQGIHEEDQTLDESAHVPGTDRSMPTLVESPIPPMDEARVTSPRPEPSHDHLKPGEADEHRRSARSGRERSGKGTRDAPQV